MPGLFSRRAAMQGTGEDLASLSHVRAQSRWRRRAIIGAIYLSVVALCVSLDPDSGVHGNSRLFESAEFSLYTLRRNIFIRRHDDIARWVQKQIVLIPLTDETFDKDWGMIPGPPAPRDYQAKVVSELTRAGVKGIVFDMVFEGATKNENDDAFAKALRASNRTVIGSWMTEEDNVFQKPLAIFGEAARVACLLAPQTREQIVIDRIPPVVTSSSGADFIPSLSVAGAMQGAGLGAAPIHRAPGGWKIGDFFLPVDKQSGTFAITFWGKPANSNGEGFFPSVPYEQIYEGAVDDDFYKKNHFFKDKIALIGDITKLGNDFRLTSVGQMAGMEIQAHAMATVLAAMKENQLFLHEAPRWLNVLMIFLLAGCACRFAASWPVHRAAIAMIVLLLGYAAFNVWLFTDHALYLHFIAPSAAVFLTTLGVLAERILSEERQKTWMRGLLQRYVSPQVANYLVAHPEKLRLGGEMVTATVLFSDIRGFTALSRRFEAQVIVGLLNEYLQAMTNVIFAYDGTLDKYMGDGIMVVFGAPEPYEDHARRAVAVAIGMQEAMEKLRENWGARGLPMLDIGVGVATGPMISGNMGAIQRREMTVIGDTVNLASRIEGLNKELGTKLLIHESTFAVVQAEIETRGPIAEHVKGHDDDVVVYEVFGWKKTEGMRAEG